ncbi:MAG: cell division protein FtsQ/DivIB [Melioribacteraceae bacterium]|nr:cell division protein FtsQ/DivIB [Melioribacteraceae bacterium]
MRIPKNIFAVIFFFIAIAGVFYFSISLKKDFEIQIRNIEIEGNNFLSKENYLRFARLINKREYNYLTLQIIKDRIEKHPYVLKADVRYDGNFKVKVKISEKNIDAILIDRENQFLITDKMQVLPILSETKNIDYPIVTNAQLNDSIKVLSSIKNNIDVLTAVKIISAVKFANPELHDFLSTIDLQNGGEISVYFSNVDYNLLIGRGNEIKKVMYFNSIWNVLKDKEINNYMEYVDLRYGGHIFLGINEINQEAEKKS